MTMKKGQKLVSAEEFNEEDFIKSSRYRTKNLPALGAFPSKEDSESGQLTF